MPIGAKTMIFFGEIGVFAFKVFRTPPPRDASGGTTGGLRPQLRRDANTEGESELSHVDRSADFSKAFAIAMQNT